MQTGRKVDPSYITQLCSEIKGYELKKTDMHVCLKMLFEMLSEQDRLSTGLYLQYKDVFQCHICCKGTTLVIYSAPIMLHCNPSYIQRWKKSGDDIFNLSRGNEEKDSNAFTAPESYVLQCCYQNFVTIQTWTRTFDFFPEKVLMICVGVFPNERVSPGDRMIIPTKIISVHGQ